MSRSGNRHVFRCLVDVPLAESAVVPLSEADATHLVQVVRRGHGDAIELIDPDGARWPAVIEGETGAIRARVTGPAMPSAPPLPVELWLGMAEWDRIEVVVQMATELGLPRLRLFMSARSGRVREEERRTARLARISAEAARQSGRGRPPAIDPLVPFPAMIDALAESPRPLVTLDAHAAAPLREVLAGQARATLVVGGEYGLSDDEVRTLADLGAIGASLGPGTLRAETAAVTALVSAATAMGAL